MTLQEADFNRCCDFIARMIEKYGDSIELPKIKGILVLYEYQLGTGERLDFTLYIEKSRVT